MLQQFFNENTFKQEEIVYRDEGIDFTHVDFIDNEPMIKLITEKPHGILPVLDEELKVIRGNDTQFVSKVSDQQGKLQCPVFEKSKFDKLLFTVTHYAGEVTYDANGFLEKNRDTLTQDLVAVLQTSKSEFINGLYPPSEAVSQADKRSSLSKQFQKQLTNLMGQLHATEPHYVRCVKPNAHKQPLSFHPRMCFEQLTYSGVFEAVSIRKQGFPFRLSHEAFVDRYHRLMKLPANASPVKGGRKGLQTVINQIIDRMKLDKDNIRIGKTRVLYRAMEYRTLELEWSILTRKENIEKALRTNYEYLSKVSLT